MNKIKYFLLVLLVIVISYFSFYKYDNKLSPYLSDNNTNNITSTNTVLVKATTSPAIEYPVITKSGVIILSEIGIYKDLNAEGKKMMDDYFKSAGFDIKYLKESRENSFLKYYDDRIATIGKYTSKPNQSMSLVFFDRKNMKIIDTSKLNIKPLDYSDAYVENKQYMLSVYDDGIVYYKAGNYDLKLLPNSALKAGETYIKFNEVVNRYEISLSSTTPGILKASVFSNVEYDGNYHKRLREVEYMLP